MGDLISDTGLEQAAEQLFQVWLTQSAALRGEFGDVFDLDFVPEPYLTFGDQSRPLIWITINPGTGFDFQRPPGSPGSLVTRDGTYRSLSKRLGEIYAARPDLITRAATSRIQAMLEFARSFGFTGVLQIERYPFHSSTISETAALQARIASSPALRGLESARRKTLEAAKAAVALACASPADRPSPGVVGALSLLNIDPRQATPFKLREAPSGRVSQALWSSPQMAGRGVLVSQGALVVPKDEGVGNSSKYYRIGCQLGWR